MDKRRLVKATGLVIMVLATGALAYSFKGSLRKIYLPGPTTVGHYQIELACDSCHSEAFSDREAMQSACVKCHGEELKEANDAHPESKFTDPRNAERVAELDARYCVTCHREHRPELVSTMGLSLPADYCLRCHRSIGEDRPSHKGLGFDTCATGACHNFHDNRALYEDFLAKHLDEPAIDPAPLNPPRDRAIPTKALRKADADAPPNVTLSDAERRAWADSEHAAGGVNCTDCHAAGGAGSWRDSMPGERCGECHGRERAGYLKGRHGMREAAGLGPMQVSDARLPMQRAASGRSLSCTSCHGAHRFDTRRAAVDACLGCHADEHSRAYKSTRHAELWLRDPTGRSGTSCATCHLPRVTEGSRVHVQHNQNDNLRPNEKMVRTVCDNCHGVGFSLAALADRALVRVNYDARPTEPVRSLDMVRSRLAAH